ncbi:ommochrome-binding protein-like [Leptidea sinapis]|uniref:Ommochrome-binding protein n=1 Tax=Leptidea sinapis TaxID=189913 RepID=A0A5E4PRD4_9NEOP|nr:ommochrome-binding protein-like [Leptidea sinapis]VVC87952.1 unnamed protein product [Leptidea sinapis]
MVSSIGLAVILAAILYVCATETHNETHKCEDILVHDKPHKKHIVSKGLNRPYQLAFDKHEHRIFFSHNIGSDNEDEFEIGYIEKNQMLPKTVASVINGFAIAVDNNDDVIYYGGSEGIYKENLKGMEAVNDTKKVHEVVKGHNIWDMFYKHALYFITYPTQHLYKLTSKNEIERQKHVHEEIYQFAIDGHDDTFITNETGLFLIKNETKERILYKGPKVFRAIEINNKGTAYFSGKNGIYVANKTHHALDLVVKVKNIFGLAFDNDDNIIYSNPHAIVKLLPGKCD